MKVEENKGSIPLLERYAPGVRQLIKAMILVPPGAIPEEDRQRRSDVIDAVTA